MDLKTGAVAEIINIESIDTEDENYEAVVKLFDTYAIWALPIIMIDAKTVSWGTTQLDTIEVALAAAVKTSEASGQPTGKATD